jgi:CDP-glucose 4,6-dehydratase
VEGVVTPSPSFWAGKRVLLTGHTGFKGAWLALWLDRLGAKVCGYALAPPTEPNLFSIAGIEGILDHVIGDVRDRDAVRRVVKQAQPEIVLHLAAQALVRKSYADPLDTLSTNIMGSAELLDALRDMPSIKSIVVVTTDKCYENREWLWPYRENDPLGGRDPYSGSKACAEIVTALYRDSFFAARHVAVASARAGNVIGGGDWAEDRLIPDILRAFSQNEILQIRNPLAVRPWQHVLEPLAGYLLLAEKSYDGDARYASAFNFGPAADDIRPVAWLVEEMTRLWGKGARWQQDRSAQPHEAQMLALDASKARGMLGWRPRLNLAQSLDWTVEWHRAIANGKSAHDISIEQIERYISLA